MTVKERKEQLRYRKTIFFLIVLNIVCAIPVFTKYFGAEPIDTVPTAGVSAYLSDLAAYCVDNPVVVEKEEVEIVMDSIDISCWQKYKPKKFKKLGRVKYGRYTYTWYSEKVLPGGGLKIPGRHLNDDLFVCDEDGYIVVASDDLPKGTIVNTPVGTQGKVYDCGSGKGNLDLYVSW